jgi:uncharacterized membrane protein
MWFVLALLSSLSNGLCAFSIKINAMKKGTSEGLFWGFYLCGSISSLTFVLLTNNLQLSWEVIAAGLIIGFPTAIGNLLYSKAVQTGPAGLTAMIAHSNVVLIVLMSYFFYEEKITWLQLVGISLLMIAIPLLQIDPNQKLRIHHRIWYVFIGITFFLFFVKYGGFKVTEEMHLNNPTILLITFLVGFSWFSLHLIIKRKDYPTGSNKGILWGLVAGILAFFANQAYITALSSGPASIISPIVSTNGVIVAILSYLVYKERLSIFQFISFCLLLIGIIFLQI